MNILINYADIGYYESQKLNSSSGLQFGADRVINYSRKDIDTEFYEKNKHILSNSRGAGFWLWKPYIILKTLIRTDINEGDYVWYNDSGAEFISNINSLIQSIPNENIILFSNNHKNIQYVKRDVLHFMNCDTLEFHNSMQVQASTQIYRKCRESIEFVSRVLELCQEERLITDNPNVCGLQNHPAFIDHRHDQSILSVVCYKANIKLHRDPTQWGIKNSYDTYPTLINHHRNNK